jgi:flagellar basal body-associated protein FliL
MRHPTRLLLASALLCSTVMAEQSANKALTIEIASNLKNKGKAAHLVLKMQVVSADAETFPILKAQEPLVRDSILQVIGKHSYPEMSKIKDSKALKKELLAAIQKSLEPEFKKPLVSDVVIDQYLAQED